jgi:hypothetical protein
MRHFVLCKYFLQFHDPIFVKYVKLNVILLLMNCSTILIYFTTMYVIKQLDRCLCILGHFNIKLQPVNGNYHLLNFPANLSVFNKKVVPLKKYMVLNSSVLISGGTYKSVPFACCNEMNRIRPC